MLIEPPPVIREPRAVASIDRTKVCLLLESLLIVLPNQINQPQPSPPAVIPIPTDVFQLVRDNRLDSALRRPFTLKRRIHEYCVPHTREDQRPARTEARLEVIRL